MRARTTLTLLLVSGALLVPHVAHSYTIVKKDGTKFEAQGPPEYKDGKATFTLAGGSKGSVAESEVNKAATEKANAAGSPKAADPKKGGVATNDSLGGSKMPAGGKGGKSTFTNEDLGKAEGKGAVEGEVKAEGSEPAAGESEEDWAKRHDEEMKRLAEQRKANAEGGEPGEKAAMQREKDAADKAKKDAEDAPAAGEEGAPAEAPKSTTTSTDEKAAPPKDETPEEKTARLEKERDELREKLNDIDKKIGGGAGDSTTVNERLETAEELNKAEEELEESRDE